MPVHQYYSSFTYVWYCGKPCLYKVQTTAPPSPMLCCRATLAPGTWRLSASPRSCQHSSEHWARPEKRIRGNELVALQVSHSILCNLIIKVRCNLTKFEYSSSFYRQSVKLTNDERNVLRTGIQDDCDDLPAANLHSLFVSPSKRCYINPSYYY